MAKDEQGTALEHWDSEELLGMAPAVKTTPDEAPTNSQEAAEGGSMAEGVDISGSGMKGPEETASELGEGVFEGDQEEQEESKTENREKGKSGAKKIWPWIVVLVLVLAVAGAAVWYFWGHKGGENDEEKVEPGTGMDAEVEAGVGSGKDESDASELEELSLDNELVQRLYGQFGAARIGSNEFYRVIRGMENTESHFGISAEGEGTSADLAKIGIAMSNLELMKCRAVAEDGEMKKRYEENYPWIAEDGAGMVNYAQCYDGQAVKTKTRELFGEEIGFYPLRVVPTEYGWNYMLNTAVAGNRVYAYDSKYDEFYHIPDGSEGRSTMGGLYAAEKDKNRVYLHEVRAFVRCSPAPYVDETTGEYVSGSYCGIFDMDSYETIAEWSDPEPAVDVEKMIQEKEKYPKFKWTFRKAETGNYVFEKLERVE